MVTGGAGFIGSALIRFLINETSFTVINIDKLTYAGSLSSLASIESSSRYQFEQVDICNSEALDRVFSKYQPDFVMHLAAESHVDRSIDGPADFIQTNVVGTFTLLESSRRYWETLSAVKQAGFRFHHVSTDEVFGDLHGCEKLFSENTPYAPSSPYSASKAGADHLVRAWYRTYGFPVVITNCSNNYGPFHYPEKFIPHMILNALSGEVLPVYGNGHQVRDWLYVEDHVRALYAIIMQGNIGETYNIGGHNEKRNIDVVLAVCTLLEDIMPKKPKGIARYEELITFVQDRPGHDQRYAIDASKIEKVLGWRPQETFESGLRKTVLWYLENQGWWQAILSGSYQLDRIGKGSE